MKGKIRSIFVDFLTLTLGNLLVILRPKKVLQLSERGLTLVLGDNLSPSERLIRRAILKKIEKTEDYNKLAQIHKTYWSNQGDDFVNKMQNKLENTNLPAYKNVLNDLKNKISNESIKFDTLIEIGTGSGRVLDYLSLSYSDINHMIGIDLSEAQIEINKTTYINNTKLEFVQADVLDWIEYQEHGNLVFLTFRGVLEYFTQQQLITFFKKLNSLGNIMFFAIEPTDSEHNYQEEPDSKVYGLEVAFSHNYKKLFEDAGFEIWYSEHKEEAWHSNIMRIIGAKNF